MNGNIYRVTYNAIRNVAELHFNNDTIKEVKMTEDEWNEVIQGDISKNLKKYLDE